MSTVDYVSTLLAAGIVALAIFFFLKAIEKRSIIQQKLEEARHNAEQSALVKEQFMANMSHEIRTPLNAILAYANILRRSDLDERQQEYAEGMQQAGENLLAIVNDILDFSKLEAGMIRLERKLRAAKTENTRLAGRLDEMEMDNQALAQNLARLAPAGMRGSAFRIDVEKRNDKLAVKGRRARMIDVSFAYYSLWDL